MVTVRIEDKAGFTICGKKIWISGPDNQQFGIFWKEQHGNGNVERLKRKRISKDKGIIGCEIIGLSDTTVDHMKREFYFYICVEIESNDQPIYDFNVLNVQPLKWAIFTQNMNTIESLIECEMYCWKDWLLHSKYVHNNGPEMEVYYQDRIEYWIPIKEIA